MVGLLSKSCLKFLRSDQMPSSITYLVSVTDLSHHVRSDEYYVVPHVSLGTLHKGYTKVHALCSQLIGNHVTILKS